jgi:dCMP deaminase
MKQKFIDYFMDVAERTSQLSHAIRLKVGAIIVKDDRIISIGYNGMPSGWDNNCEDKEYMDQTAGGWLSPEEIEEQWPWSEQQLPKTEDLPWLRYKLKTKPEVLHAETNAIAKLAKSTQSGLGATLFITHAPCLECAKLIYQSGINNILYRNSYRSDDGINFLTKSGVNVTRHPVQN